VPAQPGAVPMLLPMFPLLQMLDDHPPPYAAGGGQVVCRPVGVEGGDAEEGRVAGCGGWVEGCSSSSHNKNLFLGERVGTVVVICPR
jgi:hypothetical protein